MWTIYLTINLFYSISANTVGDEELEALLRAESVAKRNEAQ